MSTTLPNADMKAFEARNSADGLFLRYASGRLRHFWDRQVLGMSGAIVMGVVLSVPMGLVVAALILAGDAIECLILAHLVRDVRMFGMKAGQKQWASFAGGISAPLLRVDMMEQFGNTVRHKLCYWGEEALKP